MSTFSPSLDNPFIVFTIILATLIVAMILLGIRYRSRIKALENEFRSLLRIESDYIELPGDYIVEYGVFVLKRTSKTVSTGRGTVAQEIKEFKILDGKTITTRRLSINEVCNHPFLIYFYNPYDFLIIAPGFIIRSGKYKDFFGVCLNQSTIPHKSIDLQVMNPLNTVNARVEVTSGSYRASVKWVTQASHGLRVAYDEKLGLHKVVDNHTRGSGARGARLELCYETLNGLKCMNIVRTTTPNIDVINEYLWILPQNPTIVFHHYYLWDDIWRRIPLEIVEPPQGAERSRDTNKAVDKEGRSLMKLVNKVVLAGYTPKHLKAKLILDFPLRPDVVKIEEI